MKPADDTETTQPELCPNCGTVMETEDGVSYCPKCASQIDWGLGEEDGGEQ